MKTPSLILWKMFCESFELCVPQIDKKLYEESVPEQRIFGIFATITRKKRVHGCIGHIDQNLSELEKNTIVEKGVHVAHSAIFEDDRKIHFVIPIQMDPWAIISASYMLLPASTNIRNDNSNDEYGLICNSGSRLTTYLPGVFKGQMLSEIKDSLKIKADASSCEEWYKYKIISHKSSFWELMIFTFDTAKKALEVYVDTYFESNEFIFYSVEPERKFIINKTEMVRNMACIKLLSKFNVNENTKNKLDVSAELYKSQQYAVNLQNKISLGNLLSDKQSVCKKGLHNSIHDVDFTLGQYGIFYADYCESKVGDKMRELIEIKNDIARILQNRSAKYDSVFRINWYTQFLAHMLKFISLSKEKLNDSLVYEILYEISEMFEVLNSALLSVLNLPDFEKLETNHLAVAFEALCFLQSISTKLMIEFRFFNISQKYLRFGKILVPIKRMIFNLFLSLEKRKSENTDYSLYEFLDGTSRLDITCHVFSGILLLLADDSFSKNLFNYI